MLASAKQKSSRYAIRLNGIDVASFGLADLSSLPPMTEADVIANSDEIGTHRRLANAEIEIDLVDTLERHRETCKLRRFIPLKPA